MKTHALLNIGTVENIKFTVSFESEKLLLVIQSKIRSITYLYFFISCQFIICISEFKLKKRHNNDMISTCKTARDDCFVNIQSIDYYFKNTFYIIQICSAIPRGRVHNGELYAQRFQRLIYLIYLQSVS